MVKHTFNNNLYNSKLYTSNLSFLLGLRAIVFMYNIADPKASFIIDENNNDALKCKIILVLANLSKIAMAISNFSQYCSCKVIALA